MMIRINLLPSEKAGSKRAYTQIALMVVMLLMSSAIVGYLWISLNNTVTMKKRDIDDKKRIVQQLQETIKKVNELDKRKATIKNKLDIIKQAKENQPLPVKMLMALLEIIPDDIWFTQFSVMPGKGITVQGFALSYNSVGNFMTAIETSTAFKTPNLVSATKSRMANREVIRFQLGFKIDKLVETTP